MTKAAHKPFAKALRCGCFVLFVLSFVGCTRPNVVPNATQPASVATVDGVPITLAQAKEAYRLARLFDDPSGMADPKANEVLAKSVINDLIERFLLVRAANEAHVTVVGSDVEAGFAQMASGYSEKAFLALLKEHDITTLELKDAVRERLLAARYLRTQLLDRLAILDSDIDAHVLKHPEVLRAPRQVRTLHIVLEDEKRAHEVVREIRQGMSVHDAAARFSLAADGAQGGEIGLIDEGAVPKEIWAILDKAPLRQLTKPVALEDGLHLFYVTERLLARQLRLADVRLQIEARLRQAAEAEASLAHIKKLRELSHVVIDDAKLAQIYAR